MVSILDVYERAYYWHMFVPARRWHKEITALSRSGDEGLQRAGEAGINRPLPRVPFSTGVRARGEGQACPRPRRVGAEVSASPSDG